MPNMDRYEFRKINLIPDNAYPTKTPSGVPLEDLSHHACIENKRYDGYTKAREL